MNGLNPFQWHKKAHDRSDVDSGPRAQHHRLGFGSNQAAPGGYVKAYLVGEWLELPLDSPWVTDGTLAAKAGLAMYRIVNGIIQFRGRVDFGATFTVTELVSTIPGVIRTYSGVQPASTNSLNAGTGTNQTVPVRLTTGGLLQVMASVAFTAQRWLFLDGLQYDVEVEQGV